MNQRDSSLCQGTRTKMQTQSAMNLTEPTYEYIPAWLLEDLVDLIGIWTEKNGLYGNDIADLLFQHFIGELLTTKLFENNYDPRDPALYIRGFDIQKEINWHPRTNGGTQYLSRTLRDIKIAFPMIELLEEQLHLLLPTASERERLAPEAGTSVGTGIYVDSDE
jgi:hypothetical protein